MLASTDGPSATDERTASQYRLTALGLFVLGVAAGGGAVYAPTAPLQQLLVAFAGTGLFGGVLAYWIRPEATADLDPAERIYAALAATGDALERDLALGDRHVYVPADDAPDGFAPAYLAVPHGEGPIPDAGTHRPVFDRSRTERDRSKGEGMTRTPAHGSVITVYPTGAALFDAYEGVASGELPTNPVQLGDELATGAVAGLELAEGVDPTVDAPAGTATVAVEVPRFGPVTRFDHPVASFLGVGFALGLDAPVTVETLRVDDRGYRVTCEWDATASESEGGDREGTER